MEKKELSNPVMFLEDCMNNHSSIVNSENFQEFLLKLSNQLTESAQELVIKIKPLGAICAVCQRYIKGVNLEHSIQLDSNTTVCSINCQRTFKELYPNLQRIKFTDESISGSENESENILNLSKKCVIS